MTSPPRAWAEIDLAALDHNLAFARQHSGQQVMAVLKAGAYGHGLPELAHHLDSQGLPYFGVANVGEARRLSAIEIKTPLYLLGPTFPEEREEIVHNQWVPSFSTLSEIDHFTRLCDRLQKPLQAHLTLDTGMGRGGFLPHQIPEALDYLALPQNKALQLRGLGSHLPSADEDPEFTQQQFQQFDTIAQALKPNNKTTSTLYFHLSNSAGLLDYESSITNLVRPGLLLYGVSPLPHWQERLRPVMTLKSRVSLIRTLPKGHGISYGRTRILEKDTAVATIGIGYGDGLPRALSGQDAHVLINGQKAPLLGRVTMDQIMVDVSHLPHTQPGDEVELFGPNISVSQVAKWSDTIPWEVLPRITPRVTRIYTSQKTKVTSSEANRTII
jgi:alanine racemase